MEHDEFHKRLMVNVVQHYGLEPITYATVGHALNVSYETAVKNIKRFIWRVGKHSGLHVAAMCGLGITPIHQHAHLVMLAEKSISKEFLAKRWKHGTYHERNYDLTGKEGVKLSGFYALNHEFNEFFTEYCPNPKKCEKPLCIHRIKFHEGAELS